jgi:hypothetical protein
VKSPFLERNSRRVELGLIAVGLILLFFALPHEVTGDGYIRFRALRRLVDAEKIVSMGYSMVAPLLALALWPLGRVYQSAEWWIARFNWFVFTGGLFFFYRLLRQEIDPGIVRKFLLILMFGSMFPSHLKDFYGETFTAVCVGVGILAAQTGRPAWGWSGTILGTVNTPASLLGLGGVGVAETLKAKRARFLLLPVAGALLCLAESWVRRGSPWITGYEGNAGAETILTYSGRPGFSYPLFFGLLSLLFSFGKGLVFFAPGLLLSFGGTVRGLGERLARCYRLWMIFLIGLVLVYAKWWAWYGGWTWGPRFLLFASIPAALALAASLARPSPSMGKNMLLLGILALSFWVGMSGAVYGLSGLEECRAANDEFLCWYVPEFSVLWRPFVTASAPNGRQMLLLGYGLTVLAYLSLPVAGRLGRGVRQWMASLRASTFGRGDWGF